MKLAFATLSFVTRLLELVESSLGDTELHIEAQSTASDLQAQDTVSLESSWSTSFLVSHVYLLILARQLSNNIVSKYKEYLAGYQISPVESSAANIAAATDTMTLYQAATELSVSKAFVLELVAKGDLDLVADEYVTVDSVHSMGDIAHLLYIAAEAEAADVVSNFTTKPPNNGSPSTSGSAGSR